MFFGVVFLLEIDGDVEEDDEGEDIVFDVVFDVEVECYSESEDLIELVFC